MRAVGAASLGKGLRGELDMALQWRSEPHYKPPNEKKARLAFEPAQLVPEGLDPSPHPPLP